MIILMQRQNNVMCTEEKCKTCKFWFHETCCNENSMRFASVTDPVDSCATWEQKIKFNMAIKREGASANG